MQGDGVVVREFALPLVIVGDKCVFEGLRLLDVFEVADVRPGVDVVVQLGVFVIGALAVLLEKGLVRAHVGGQQCVVM